LTCSKLASEGIRMLQSCINPRKIMLFLVNRMALRIWLENEQLVFFNRKRLKNNCAVYIKFLSKFLFATFSLIKK